MKTKKEIREILAAIKYLKDNATDEQAQNAAVLYPEWDLEKEYKAGERIRKNKKVITVSERHLQEWREERKKRHQE